MTKEEALSKLTFILEYRNDSPNTITMYNFYLGKFFDTLPDDIDISSLTVDDAIQYIVHLKQTTSLSPASLNLIISDIRTFFELVLDRPISKTKFPRIKYTSKETYVFSREEINRLYALADVRMRAIITLGFDCGLRVSEVVHLKISDIDSKNMLIHIRETKRNKNRYVKLSDFCLNTLRTYWKVYQPNDYLFAGRTTHLQKGVVQLYFRRLMTRAGITAENARFHSLRAFYATTMVQYGCDIFMLKRLMGHSSITSTARYVGLDHSKIEAIFSPSDSGHSHE